MQIPSTGIFNPKLFMITQETYKILRAKLNPYLNIISKEMGISISMGNGSYRGNEGSLKLHLTSLNENGEAVDRSTDDFKTYAKSYGLDPSDLGKEFFCMGETYKITGITTRRYKMPINATRVRDGKKFKFPASSVQIGLHLIAPKKVADEFNEFNRVPDGLRKTIEELNSEDR